MIEVRLARLTDVPLLWEHLKRHGQESGRDGDLIFAPYEEPWAKSLDELQKEKEAKWQRPVDEIGWERCWILGDSAQVYGELRLVHAMGLKTSLHRAMLMMGIERSQRGKGMGSLLIEAALNWTRQQPSIDWIQLCVFSHNEPARKLYRRFGFEEVGINRDLFRVQGQRIDDIEMSLNIRQKMSGGDPEARNRELDAMICLEPMSETDFHEYVERSCRSFAEESPRYRGIPIEQAVLSARDEFLTKIMPQGFKTPGHLLWNVYEGATRVGYIHLGEPQQPVAKEIFAWDFEIFENFRRKGLGRQAMVETGRKLREIGYTKVGLNVFGDNKAAIKLYESMGFGITQVQMAREIQ